ncbi:MAG: hypothetical protein GAK45_02478 [Pseudomonas citronellolis]|nr:MAG: hypothetical protein GAK45_02478 [Pseudomonas citronellolis]
MPSDDHQVTGDRRWRGGVVAAGGEWADAGGQVDRTLVGEAFADLAVVGVDRDQAGIGSGQVEASWAGLGNDLAGIGDLRRRAAVTADVAVLVIVRNAAAGHVGEALEGLDRALDLRVEAPDFGTGVRVQGQHLAVRGAGIEHAVGLEWGVFVGQFDRVVFGRQVAGANAPGFFQAISVLRSDLAQGRVAVAVFGAPVGLPFAVRHGRRCTGHFAAVTPQFAEDLPGMGELATDRGCAGGDYGGGQQGAVDLRGRPKQRAARPGQQQDHAEGEPDGQAWHQLPPVQTHFPQRPGGAGQQHHAIQAKADAAQGDQQDARKGKADPADQVVQGSAQLAQLDTACDQGQAHQQQQHAYEAR